MDQVNAALEWKDGKIYLFGGNEYVRLNPLTNSADAGYPKPIFPAWRGLFDRDIDAAVLWNNGKAYFFKGDEYTAYDVTGDKADAGYPRKIKDGWKGVFDRDIDAAVLWNNGKAYFFKGDEYTRFDVVADKADPDYPKKIKDSWGELFAADIDDAANWGPGKVLFVKGNEYLIYDKSPEHAGPPQPIPSSWFGLPSQPQPSTETPAETPDETTASSATSELSARRKRVIDELLPGVLPSAYGQQKFTKLTFGLTKDNPNVVSHPGFTTCGSLPMYVARMLKDMLIGGTNGVRTAGEKKNAWVVADGTNRPRPGDLYALLNKDATDVVNGGIAHVGVIVDASGDEWKTADAGQGDGWAADYVTRKYDTNANTLSGEILQAAGARPPRVLAGWIDIDQYPFPDSQ